MNRNILPIDHTVQRTQRCFEHAGDCLLSRLVWLAGHFARTKAPLITIPRQPFDPVCAGLVEITKSPGYFARILNALLPEHLPRLIGRRIERMTAALHTMERDRQV